MEVRASVFISHTSDMAEFPASRSYVQAAVDATLKAGVVPVDMAYFVAREGQPAEYCQQRVRECDIYIGVVGFRYGSLVPGRTDGASYTDLEFRTATESRLPRLLFMLPGDLLWITVGERTEGAGLAAKIGELC